MKKNTVVVVFEGVLGKYYTPGTMHEGHKCCVMLIDNTYFTTSYYDPKHRDDGGWINTGDDIETSHAILSLALMAKLNG